MSGWVKIHRKLTEHWLWNDPIKLKWWLAIILEVNHSDKKISLGNSLYLVKRGQSAKSLRTWAIQFGTGVKSVTNFFDLLESDGMISKQTIGKGKQSTTLINVTNYDLFQTQQETQEATKETTQRKPERLTNNNEKKEKELKNKNIHISESDFISIWSRARLHYDNVKTGFTKLSKPEQRLFTELICDYNKSQFEHAVAGLFFQDTLPVVRVRPAYFLKPENFTTYLDCWLNQNKIFDNSRDRQQNKATAPRHNRKQF